MRLRTIRPLPLPVYVSMVFGFGTVGFLIVVWVVSLALSGGSDTGAVRVEPSGVEAAEAQLRKSKPLDFDLESDNPGLKSRGLPW